MSPTKKKSVRKPVKRAPRKAASKPAAPKRLNANFRDVNVVWYNVKDWERGKKFYRDTLSLPVVMEMDQAGWAEYGHPNQTHVAINLWRGPEAMPPTHGGATVTFGCDDTRAMVAKLRAKGVKCDEPDEIPGMVILATFYDPEGNRLQISQTLVK